MVTIAATISSSPLSRAIFSAHALSLPPLHDINAFCLAMFFPLLFKRPVIPRIPAPKK
jgi:hypothetical protein